MKSVLSRHILCKHLEGKPYHEPPTADLYGFRVKNCQLSVQLVLIIVGSCLLSQESERRDQKFVSVHVTLQKLYISSL